MKKILFISHDASRTGAPLVLLHLIQWLNNNSPSIKIDILLLKGGSLEVDFRKVCDKTFVFSEIYKPEKLSVLIVNKIFSKLGIKNNNKELLFLNNIASNNYDIIYANTIVSLPIGEKIKKANQQSKLIVHVHELNTVIKMLTPNFDEYIGYIDRYIAASHQVKNNLIDSWNVKSGLIEVIYPFAAFGKANSIKTKETFIVGASGNADWRKGDDLFIQVAKYVTENYSNARIKFVWVGNNTNNKCIIDNDIKKLGLNKVVDFVGEQINPLNFYKEFNVFLLTSREDPFPLVCIEVAELKKPIICFDKASGTAEVIKQGGGFVVPYIDIEAMGEKIMYYYNNKTALEKDGEKVCKLFFEFTPENKCPQIYGELIKLMETNSNYE